MNRGCGSGLSSHPNSSRRRSLRPMAASCPATPSAKRGWISPTTASTATIRCWSRWPTRLNRCSCSIEAATALPRNRRTFSWTKPSRFAGRAGFRKILMRGDTKFAQTRHLDRWDEAGDIRFIFGYEAYDSLKARADELPASSYRLLKRLPQYQIKTSPRAKARAVQARDRPRTRIREHPPARGDGRGVRLSADRLQEELSDDRSSQAGGGRQGTDCGCSRSTATSFTSPTIVR